MNQSEILYAVDWKMAVHNGNANFPQQRHLSSYNSLVISRIMCIGTYSILCDSGAYTSFYAYTLF